MSEVRGHFHSFPSIDLIDESDTNYAVRVEGLSFGYNDKIDVLRNFSVRIAQGGIFALLGSNGCGKTTLLKIILGRLKPKDGWVRVLGLEPSHKLSDIPGPGVGYMPQEIALFTDFTIKECLNFFGKLYKIEESLVQQRIELLVQLLYLPSMERKLCQLSGGQQRLVSLAITIIHRPKLLILDEPTVGVDPVLRCRIWSYLENVSKNYGTTVLITTHYIEEAKNAHSVGFISTGILLKQSTPHELLRHFECKTLEEVFLILCQNHYLYIKEGKQYKKIEKERSPEPENILLSDAEQNNFKKGIDFERIGALLTKSMIRIKRSHFVISSFFILPFITILVYRHTVGTKPRHIPIAIYTGNDPETNHTAHRLLDLFEPDHFKFNFYQSEEKAINSVQNGKDMYALSFPVNYTWNLKERLPHPFDVSDEVLNKSTIRAYVDHSDTIVATFVRYTYIIDPLLRFLKKLGLELGLNPYAIGRPIDSSKPIFPGSFLHCETYPSAGILLVAVYMTNMAFSAMVFISELKNKSLERLYISGVKPIEIFFVHMIEMITLIAIQVLLVTLLIHFLFDIPIDVIFLHSYAMVYLNGLEGAGTGLLIALILKDEILVFIISVGIIIPLMTCSGVIWPLEAIPLEFRLIIDWTPITLPLDSLRSILFRRLTISEPRVYIGFIICISYNIIIYSVNLLLVTYLKDFNFPAFFQLKFRGSN